MSLGERDGERFLKFLCRIVDPVVRRDADEAEALVRFFNACMAKGGLELAEADRLPTLDDRERVTYAAKSKHRNPGTIDLKVFKRLSEPAALEEHLKRIESGIERARPYRATALRMRQPVCRLGAELRSRFQGAVAVEDDDLPLGRFHSE